MSISLGPTIAPQPVPRVIDPASAVETVRLLNSARLYTQLMGGLLPEQPDPLALQDVLDVGCGPGVWALDLAFTYPDTRVVGVDLSEQRISYACCMAREQGLYNARFLTMDATGPLAIPDAAFDLVNVQLFLEELPLESWMPFLSECKRILRPGGTLRLTESEVGFSNSPAHESFWQCYLRARSRASHSCSPDGRHLGIINQLQPLLRRAGFHSPVSSCQLYAVEYSSRVGKYHSWYEDLMLKVHHLQPFLVKMDVASAQELEQRVRRMQEEVWHPNFNGMNILLTAWGQKP